VAVQAHSQLWLSSTGEDAPFIMCLMTFTLEQLTRNWWLVGLLDNVLHQSIEMNGDAGGGAGTAAASLLFKPAPWEFKGKEEQNSWEDGRVDDCKGFCCVSVYLRICVGACKCALLDAYVHAHFECSSACMHNCVLCLSNTLI
jgi:hypothetical protein